MVEQKNKCAMCGKELEDKEFTLHHIKPRAEGGKDELDNLIGLCNPCHDIAEDKKLNREEIINGYEEPKPIKYIRKVYFNEPEQEYKYPEEIILHKKYKYNFQATCPKCGSKDIYITNVRINKFYCRRCGYISKKEEFFLKEVCNVS